VSYANYVLAVLFLAYVINFVDRQIVSILAEPIKQALGVSDSWIGFLGGPAFAIFYATLGIPIARLADLWVRRSVIAIGLALWSGMTALSGLSQTFTHLALARIGVGVGEAALSPPAHSLLADYFPVSRRRPRSGLRDGHPHRRARRASCWAAGSRSSGAGAPRSWWWACPGLILALVVRFTVREPVRGAQEATRCRVRRRRSPKWCASSPRGARSSISRSASDSPPSRVCVRVLGAAVPAPRARDEQRRARHEDRHRARHRRRDRLGARRHARRPARPPRRALVAVDPRDRVRRALAVHPDVPSGPRSGPGAADILSRRGDRRDVPGPVFSTVQTLAPVQMRAVASGVLMFVTNIIGLALGPQSIGWLNDYVFASHGDEAVRYSLLLVLLVMGVWSALHFMLAARALPADLARREA
jgi:MFS family permease